MESKSIHRVVRPLSEHRERPLTIAGESASSVGSETQKTRPKSIVVESQPETSPVPIKVPPIVSTDRLCN